MNTNVDGLESLVVIVPYFLKTQTIPPSDDMVSSEKSHIYFNSVKEADK